MRKTGKRNILIRRIFFLAALFVFSSLLTGKVFASESVLYPAIPGELSVDENFDFSGMESVIKKGESAFTPDLKDMFLKALNGEIELSPSIMADTLLRLLFNEIYLNIGLMRNIVILGVFSAAIKVFMDSFKNKNIAEIGFYVSYAAMVITLLSSFYISAGILNDMVVSVTELIESGVPLFVSLVIMSGNFTGGYVFNSIMIFSARFVSRFIMIFIGPAVMSMALLQTVNYLAENDTLTHFSKLIKNIVSWTVRAIAIGLVSIISIQKLSAPLINSLALKTAKSTVNAVPIVGGILTGAVESILQWTAACRGGVLIVLIFAMVSVCLIPIVKLIALIFVYKLTAAVIQPVCDKRFVDCVNSVGDYTAILLSCGTVVSLMFLVCVVIMLSF
jgi:stage III sporulation protein AE